MSEIAAAAVAGSQPEQSKVTKNVMIYMTGQVFTWVATLLHIVMIPHFFAPGQVGAASLAANIVTPVSTLLLLCTEQFLTVEAGRKGDGANILFQAAIGLRIVLLPVLVVSCIVAFKIAHADPLVMGLGAVLLCGAAATFMGGLFTALLMGREDAKRTSTIGVIGSFAAVLCIPFMPLGQFPATISYILMASVFPFILQIRWLRPITSLKPVFKLSLWKMLLIGGLPFLANTVVIQLYAPVTTWILKHFSDEATVGTYYTASRLSGTVFFLPSALSMALLPQAARQATSDLASLERLQARTFKLVLVAGLWASVLLYLIGAPLTDRLYGTRYLGIPLMMQAAAFNVFPVYLVTTLYTFLVARKQNGRWSLFLIGTVLLNALLCWVLIPWSAKVWGNAGVGAMLASGTAEVVTVIFAVQLLKIRLFDRDTAGKALRGLIACAIMTAVVIGMNHILRGYLTLINAIVGTFVFFLCVYFFGVLEPEEQKKAHALFNRLGMHAISRS